MKNKKSSQLKKYGMFALSTLVLITANDIHAESFTDALIGGKVNLDMRLRYEYVDQDNILDDANAFTLRTRLGYKTANFMGFAAMVEMENNAPIVEDYNSGPGGNNKTEYSVVADQEATEVNQAFLEFDAIPATPLKVGRQRIILDNARFVGNVGFRQLEQTFDAARIENSSIQDTTLLYSYVDNVRNIFSTDEDTRSHLINLHYSGWQFGTFTGYGYLLEFPDKEANSQQTYGLRFAGSTALTDAKILYAAEYAQQSDYKDGDGGIDGDYYHIMLGSSLHGITGKIGYEVLGSDEYSGFETPFATKHAFNGWADTFLNTPTQGLRDGYLMVGGKVADINLKGIYHDFQADSGGADYGQEWDLSATYGFLEHYTVGLIYANYNSDQYGVDTEKVWLWAGLKF
ncbi:MAG: alginate export family protein [Thermodesulfobacteriota bacterium]